jgi:hypothetical protein
MLKYSEELALLSKFKLLTSYIFVLSSSLLNKSGIINYSKFTTIMKKNIEIDANIAATRPIALILAFIDY